MIKILFSIFIFTSSSVFSVDFTAIDAASRNLKNVSSPEQVAKEILKFVKTDWEKVRAAFIWMTDNIAYDVPSFLANKIPSQAGGDVFNSKKAVCAGYSELYKSICASMGIDMVSVTGSAKGYNYAVSGKLAGHAWNVVKINGSWHLFDSTWGAGYLGDDKKYHKEYNEYWFDTKAEQFLYSHLPKEEAYQLLAEPITEAAFSKLPDLRLKFKSFSKMGFSLPTTVEELAKLKFPTFYDTEGIDIKILRAPLTDVLQSGERRYLQLKLKMWKKLLWSITKSGFTSIKKAMAL